MLANRFFAIGSLLVVSFTPLFSQEFISNFGPQVKGLAKVTSVDVAPNGDVLAVGDFDYFNNEVSGRVLRLDANGDWAPGFNKVFTDDEVTKVIALLDGKILIQGLFTRVNGHAAKYLARLNADGSFDASFSNGYPNPIYDFELQSTGKIVLSPRNIVNGVVYRLNADGSLDNSFNTIPMLSTFINLHIDNQDRILACTALNVVRLNSNGVKDNSFNASLDATGGAIYAFAIQPDGKILLGGGFTKIAGVFRDRLVRLNENGTLDNTFTGSVDYGSINVIQLTSDGKILVAGLMSYVYKFSSTGDSRQIVTALYPNTVLGLKVTSNDDMVAGGWFTSIGNPQPSLAKIKADHSPDLQFNPAIATTAMGGGENMAISPSGEIYLGGFDPNLIIDGVKAPLKRLTKNGVVDGSYVPSFGNNTLIHAMAVQDNNRLLLTGFININETYKNLVRLKSDGTVDASFNEGGSGPNIPAVKILFNGSSIFLSGYFNTYNGILTRAFVILDHQGKIKYQCKVFGETSNVSNFDFQTDGKIIVIGRLVMPDGTTKGMARLNKDGTLDNTFTPKDIAYIATVKIDKQNRIYFGTWLPGYNGSILVRLKSNGEQDMSFEKGLYFSGSEQDREISRIDILPSNKIVVGGRFTKFNDVEANGLIIFDKELDTFIVPTEPLSASSKIKHVLYHGSHIYVGGRLSFNDGQKIISLGKLKLNAADFIDPDQPVYAAYRVEESQPTQLEWTDNTDTEDGYEIERYSEAQAGYVPISTTPASWTGFLDTENPGVETRYRIRSYNEKSKSEYQYLTLAVTPEEPPGVVTGLEPHNEALSVYPNPAKDIIMITAREPISQVSLINALGQDSQNLIIDIQDQHAHLHLGSLSKGVYLIQVWSGNKLTKVRVVKE